MVPPSFSSSTTFAKPRSQIFNWSPLKIRFAGLISLCTTFLSNKLEYPPTIYFKYFNASSSFNCFLSFRYFSKLMPSQYSVIIYRLFGVLTADRQFTMLGWCTVCATWISLKTSSWNFGLEKSLFEIFFIATGTFVLVQKPL